MYLYDCMIEASDAVPVIEAVAPGVEAIVIPRGGEGFLSLEGLPVCAYVIGDGREVILVDAGYGTRLSNEAISSAIAGRRLAAILLTHRHPDHGGGARALAARFGAPVYARALEAESFGADPDLAPIDVAEGDAFEAAGRRLVAVFAAGHTLGSLAFHEPSSGLLFSGDAILGEGTVVVGPPDGDMTAYVATLERLRALTPLRAILPGHGPRIDDPLDRVDLYLRHRRLRESQVLAILAEGPTTADRVVAAIYEGQVPGELLPLARISALGQLEKLVAEGRAARLGDVFRRAT